MKSLIDCRHLNIKAILINSLLFISLFTLPITASYAGNELSTLQKQIKKSKSSQAQQAKQRKILEARVANSEQQTAKAILQAQQTKQAIATERAHLIKLQKQTAALKENKLKQQKLLEQQLISAYMAGQNDLIKLLLNQEDISKIIRAKSYYFYLNKARLESIKTLQNTLAQLDTNKQQQSESLQALERMYKQQKIVKGKLLEQSKQRSIALRELKQDLNYQNARLSQLNDAEKRLKSKLAKERAVRRERELEAAKKQAAKKLARKKAEQSYSSIAKKRGRLRWPINGEVLASFDSQRSSQVKWKGIAIAANEGEKVRAVATGRVLFAGYFKGYGMVIALDHSDDYITLYGYNQTLLQKTGDMVLQGDAIALAGHSGGQEKNSLYFELSHKGKAQNPLKWLKKRR